MNLPDIIFIAMQKLHTFIPTFANTENVATNIGKM